MDRGEHSVTSDCVRVQQCVVCCFHSVGQNYTLFVGWASVRHVV